MFAKLMAGLSSSTNKKYSADEIEFWFKAFSDLSPEFVEAGFQRFVLTGDDWPSIAKIRRLALEQASGRHLTAGEAFSEVLTAVRLFGRNQKPEAFATFDQITQLTVEQCGGWNWFCELNSDNRTTISAQFERRYNAIVERVVESRCLPEPLRPRSIAGSHESVRLLSESMGTKGDS